jgi:hypothetical protein
MHAPVEVSIFFEYLKPNFKIFITIVQKPSSRKVCTE